MDIYGYIYNSCVFPFFEGVVKGRKTYAYYKYLLGSQWRSFDENNKFQLNQLKNLLAYAKENCVYYEETFRARGFDPQEIQSASDISVLPILTKDIIRDKGKDLKSKALDGKLWEKSTGGSTGQPLHFYYTKESYEWRVAISKRGYSWAGAGPGSRQAYIWGGPIGDLTRIRKIKESLHHLVDRQRYFDSFHFDEQMMSKCLSELRKLPSPRCHRIHKPSLSSCLAC